jgi:hypothetical protein
MNLRFKSRKNIATQQDSGPVVAGIIMLGVLYTLSFFLQGFMYLMLAICIIATTETICRKRFSRSLLEILSPIRSQQVTERNKSDLSTKKDS